MDTKYRREIKFRGNSKQTGNIVYGWGCYTDENMKQFIINDSKKFIEVDEIQQFTGVKTRVGNKEVYQNDIVKITVMPAFLDSKPKYATGVVEYIDVQAGFYVDNLYPANYIEEILGRVQMYPIK